VSGTREPPIARCSAEHVTYPEEVASVSLQQISTHKGAEPLLVQKRSTAKFQATLHTPPFVHCASFAAAGASETPVRSGVSTPRLTALYKGATSTSRRTLFLLITGVLPYGTPYHRPVNNVLALQAPTVELGNAANSFHWRNYAAPSRRHCAMAGIAPSYMLSSCCPE
jgi:hypothetical protein